MTGTMFTATSVAKTKAALKMAQAKMYAAAPSAEEAGAEVVAREMAGRAPVLTGRLRASIHTDGSSAVADAPYAVPVERGHGTAAPQRFAEDASRAAERGVEAAMIAVFRTALGGK